MNSLPVKANFLLFMVLAQCAFSAESPSPVSPAPTATAPTNAIGPRIEFDALVHDFGKVTAGQVVRHDFIFTNTGDAALEISGVHPSCGCTTAGTWTSRVEPGKTGTIPLLFNSGRFNGAIAKTASVLCNDKSQPQVTLQIRCTIWKPIEVNPQTAVLNVVADSPSNPPVTVTIVSSLPEPISLSDPESNNRAFAAEIKTIRPGKEFQLIISPIAPLNQGTTQGMISVKTSSTNVPSIEVIAFVNVRSAWVVTPKEIMLPPGPLSSAFSCAVSIQNNTAAEMSLSEPALNASDVPVDMKEVVPGHQFTLSLTFRAGFHVAHGEQVILTVKTSDPKNPVIKVPVHQNLLPNTHEVGLPTLHRGPVPPVPAK